MFRSRRCATGVLVGLMFGVTAATNREPAASQANDDRAAHIVRAAVSALGGDRLPAAGAWYVEGAGRENLTGELQGLAPSAPTWRPHAECVGVDASTLAIAWGRRSPRNDRSVRWRRMIYTAETSGFVDWVSGAGVLRPTPIAEPRRLALARRVPHLLVREAAGAPVRWTGTLQVGVTRNPHTDDNLMSWLPAERILFQGDLFYYSDPADFPPAGRVVMNRFFANWLAGRGLQPLGIYGVHNALVAGPAHLRAAAADGRQPPASEGPAGCGSAPVLREDRR